MPPSSPRPVLRREQPSQRSQVCVSTERMPRAQARLRRGAGASRGLRRGRRADGRGAHGADDPRRQRAVVVEHVRDALGKGARLLLGGDDLDSEGNFLQPVVLADVRPDMRIMQEETFGPVACVSSYDDVDDAIACANDHVYALGAVVFGQDLDEA